MSLICILYNKHFNIIVLSVLRFTASDYPYAIFQRFYPWYLYLCTHTGVQYSFHIISYSCRLPVPWQMPLIEQELLSTWVHPAFNRVRVVQSFIFFIVFYRSVFQFVLQFTMSDCPFGIFKFFFCDINIKLNYPYLNWQCFSPG